MAHLHFDITPRTRRGSATTAKRAVAYLVREGSYAPAAREVDYLTRASTDTRKRDDLVWQDTRNMPRFAHDNPYNFFESAAAYERKNGQWAIAVQASLPRELSRVQQLEIIEDFLGSQLRDKPLLVVLHEPRARDGELQPHIHVLFNARTNDGIDRSASGYFRQAHRQAKEPGAAKDRFWTHKQAPARVRHAYSDIVNAALERAGVTERMDPRSLFTRSIDREVAPKASQEDLARTRADEQRIAHEYWAQRKITLGLRPRDITQREVVQTRAYQWSRDMRNLVDRSPDRAQELRQAWTQTAKQAWVIHDQQRSQAREHSRTPALPQRAYPRGHFSADLEREGLDR
jgi:MobA/MobL family